MSSDINDTSLQFNIVAAETSYTEAFKRQRRKFLSVLLILIAEAAVLFCFLFFNFQNKFPLRVYREMEMRSNGYIQLSMGTYRGETDFGFFDGQGAVLFNDGHSLSGSWDDNIIVGRAFEVFPSQGKYEGDYTGMMRSGQGTFRWYSGDFYYGEWKDDMISGKGTYVSGSNCYEGTFYQNAFQDGTYTFTNDDVDIVLHYIDGSPRSADIAYSDGDTYSGSVGYLSGKLPLVRIGEGTYKWKSGESYSGIWSADQMSGQGIYNYADGSTLSGTFENSKFISGTYHTVKSFGDYTFTVDSGEIKSVTIVLPDGTKVTSDMDSNGLNGSAKIQYSNGDSYSGEVVNGLKSGNGQYTWANGCSYNGDWANDTMHGSGTYTFSASDEGDSLSGSFSNGVPDGQCTYSLKNGHSYKTTWSDGICTKVEE
jgi:hypothetical protein